MEATNGKHEVNRWNISTSSNCNPELNHPYVVEVDILPYKSYKRQVHVCPSVSSRAAGPQPQQRHTNSTAAAGGVLAWGSLPLRKLSPGDFTHDFRLTSQLEGFGNGNLQLNGCRL